MKGIRVSLVLLVILSLLLSFSTASAKVTRIYFYQVGGDECPAELEPPLISGPNVHLHGTYTCPTVAYTMDGDPFPMFTGIIYWTDAHAQFVDGHGITTAKLRMETDEGGVWEGSFAWPATGVLKGVYQGQGIYQGMTVYGTYDPVTGFNGGYVQFNSNK